MWWYNIIWGNKGITSNILQLDSINAGSDLLNANLISLKRKNTEPILTGKRIEWSKFIDYFVLNIEADPSRVVKKNVYFLLIGYILIPSSRNIHMARHHLGEYFNLETPKILPQQVFCFAEVKSNISFALRDMCVIFEKYILSGSNKLADVEPAGILDSLYGKQKEQKNT